MGKRVKLGGLGKKPTDDLAGGTTRDPKPNASADASESSQAARERYDEPTVRRKAKPTGGSTAPTPSTSAQSPGDPGTVRYGKRRKINPDLTETQEEADRSLAGWLVVIEGPGVGTALTIAAGLNRVGRSADADISLAFGDEGISSVDHCFVIYDPRNQEFSVQNGLGKNLTYVDDALAVERRVIKRGSLISMSDTTLRFVPFCDDQFDWSDDI